MPTKQAKDSGADTTEIVEAPKNEIAAPSAGFQIDASDIDIPRLNLIQKQSQIDGDVGSIVINKEHQIAAEDEVLKVVVISAQKGWRENIPYDNDEMPRFTFNEAEVAAIEADSEYDVIEFAEINLLIEQPEGNDDTAAFPFTIDDKNYAIGRVQVSKDAYRCTYKRLATFAAFNPTVPIHGKVWNFKSSSFSRGKYTWFVPYLDVSASETTPEVASFVKRFTS